MWRLWNRWAKSRGLFRLSGQSYPVFCQCVVTVGMPVTRHPPQVSSPRELPPQALSDPYVNLSIHTAPIVQPFLIQHLNDFTFSNRILPFPGCSVVKS